MSEIVDFQEWISDFDISPLKPFRDLLPWDITASSERIVNSILNSLGSDFSINESVAVSKSAVIESSATIKGPAIIGPNCLVASGAYIRGGCWLQSNNILGPACELKSSFLFADTKLAHLNFVGDSIIGRGSNIEAGAMIANYRNEMADPAISIFHQGAVIHTGARKFGALLGDHCKIGANAVIAPGAMLDRRTIVNRLSLVDQSVEC
tara:strand:- start:407 stop:1030 length:624 start_codon:yes stop_codon:yes gene_type:complete